jgi:hypothetical protein
MEVALRILSWSWLFPAFHASRAWSDVAFRERFLCALYLHGDFTERHIERSDVNGNHFTADAAGMVFAGLFFGRGSDAARWHACGWSHLCDELPRQVFPDGVDFEASVGYHRLVAELFLLPALYRRACGLEVPDGYAQRLQAMARFTAAYSRPDGGSPLWGDADDARALPLGRQALTDHRYLVGLAGAAFDVAELRDASGGPRGEAFWLLGPVAAASLPASDTPPRPPGSSAFADGGFYVMRNATDHVFVDCGPVGLAGRGGHGHNDCLAFEAALDGVLLVSDCGLFVYSASFAERNNFRSTAYHNTPSIDGQEINRIDPKLLWMLANDAEPRVLSFERGRERGPLHGLPHGVRAAGAAGDTRPHDRARPRAAQPHSPRRVRRLRPAPARGAAPSRARRRGGGACARRRRAARGRTRLRAGMGTSRGLGARARRGSRRSELRRRAARGPAALHA